MNMEQNHITTNIVKNLITLRGHLEIRDYDVVLLLIVLKKFHLIDSNIDGAFYNVYNIVREKINSRVVALEKSADFDMIDKIVALEKVISHYDSTLNQMKPQQLEEILYVLDSISDEEKNYTEVFTEFLHTWQKGLGRSEDQILQPKELTSFINELVGDKSQLDIYNPFAGAASFALESNYRSYYGQEIGMKVWAIGILNLIINDAFSNSEFKCKDSINYWPSKDQKFDLIVANPPLNMRLDRHLSHDLILPVRTTEQFVILKGLENLRADGKMILVTRMSFLFSGGIDKQIREHLVNENLIDTIIQLPRGILYNTGVVTCLVVLNKNKSDNNIRFIDGSSYYFNKGRYTSLDNERLYSDIQSNNQDVSITASLEEVIDNDYNLQFGLYRIFESDEIRDGFELKTLNELLQPLLVPATIEGKGKGVKIANLLDDPFNAKLEISPLEEIDLKDRRWSKIDKPALLVSKRFQKLKPSIFECSDSNHIYISQDILACEVSPTIDISYLVWQLTSDTVLKQVSLLSTDGAMPNITLENFLKIKIEVPVGVDSLLKQKELYRTAKIQADRDKIVQSNLQDTIDALIKEQTNKYQWQLHRLRNTTLLSIKNKGSLLNNYFKLNNEIGSKIIDANRNFSIAEYTTSLLASITELMNEIEEIYTLPDISAEKQKVALIPFLENYVKTQKFIDEQIFQFVKIIEDLSLEDINSIRININIDNLTHILDNIFSNILIHGFHEKIDPNFHRINLHLRINNDEIELVIANNGAYVNISQDDYFADGGIQGKTGNTGKGGHIIKTLVENAGGKVEIATYEPELEWDDVFEIKIHFKIVHDEI